jgi:hypothetical protein
MFDYCRRIPFLLETTFVMIGKPSLSYRLTQGDLALIFYFSVFRLLFHLAVNLSGGYGFFRDELYYLACADHLSAGYVDQPPFSLLILKIATSVFGDSLFAVRLVPAILSSAGLFVTGLIVIRLGGGKVAQLIALVAWSTLINIAMHSYYSMNAIDFLIWALVFLFVLRIIQDERKVDWILLGCILGIGLMNKIGVLFLGAGLFLGVVLTDQRKWLRTRWPYICAAIAFILFLPYVIWNLQHDLAHLEFIRNASGNKYAGLSAFDFLVGQLLYNNPVAVLVWVPGLFALLFYRSFKRYRALAYLYVGPLLIFLANGTSKAEYLAPAYTILWAAGAVFIERWTAKSVGRRWLPYTLAILIGLMSIVFLPMVSPILPVERFISYSETLNFKPSSSESKELGELPQFYADMFGWEQKARDVAKAFSTLSPEDRSKCAIFGNNYGRCGAIDYFGREYGLPKSIGTHNNYWIWGPRNYTGEVLIIMGGTLEDHQDDFAAVELAVVSDCDYCMPYEDKMNVFICRGLKENISEVWQSEKHFE